MQGTSKAFSVELKHFHREDPAGYPRRSTSFIVAFDLSLLSHVNIYKCMPTSQQTSLTSYLEIMFFAVIVTEAPVYHPHETPRPD